MKRDMKNFTKLLTSGNSEKVNIAIDKIKDIELEERTQLFRGFDEFMKLYKKGDGYQRLSVVRFLKELFHPQIQDKSKRKLMNLYLKSIQDEDGRVRLSTIRGIQLLAIYMQIFRERDKVLLLKSELEKTVKKYSGKKKAHIRQALEYVNQFLNPSFEKFLKGMRKRSMGN